MTPEDLRAAFGSFMTGVTIVTCRGPDGARLGFTANSFTSVSLDPPLLLVCPGKFLSCYNSFVRCHSFAVNVLAEGQEDVSNIFASYKGDRFSRVAYRDDRLGNPLIDGAVAQFSCRTDQVLETGDHSILIGRVEDVRHLGGRGLGYVKGQYFSLGLEREALQIPSGQAVAGAIIERNGAVLLEKTPEGYRPPQTTLEARAQLRHALKTELARQGLPVRLGAAYSVFDDAGTHHTYLLASAEAAPANPAIKPVPHDALAQLAYTARPIADMMTRFATEARTRSFGLYLGDGARGDVHSQTERT